MSHRRLPGVGLELGKYELLERLAVGGMGEIFLARERAAYGVSRLVVIKQLLPDLAENPESVEMFLHEARVWAHLVHPNIVQIHELGQEQGSYFLAMEYVPGQNVSRMILRLGQQQKKLDRAHALHIVLQVARALDYAHHARDDQGRPLGIVHRDVSPHNVLISFTGDVKLTDFGIARSASRLQRTETGVVRGKVSYLSPEQLLAKPVDPRADLYSLGVILWELTLGRRLFDSSSDAIPLVTSRQVPPPRSFEADYPEALERIVMGLLEVDVQRRTASAAQLASDLRAFMAEARVVVDTDALGATVRELFETENRRFEQLKAEPTGLSEQKTIARDEHHTEGFAREPGAPSDPPRRWWAWVAAVGAGLVAAASFALAFRPHPQATPAAPSVSPAPAPVASPATVVPARAAAPPPSAIAPEPTAAAPKTPKKKAAPARAAAPVASPPATTAVPSPPPPSHPLDKYFDP